MLPPALIAALQPVVDECSQGTNRPETATDAPGAYLLALHVKRPIRLDIARLAHPIVVPGWYVYAGSARGPGGMRARLKRHFRVDKRHHWHIDYLSSRVPVSSAFTTTKHGECDLVFQLLAADDFQIALAGFGASDCRRCKSHLVKWSG